MARRSRFSTCGLAFVTRVAIHLFFIAALVVMGLATTEPVILAVAVILLAVELPLAWLTERRHSAATRPVGRFEGAVSET